jgi:Spy/CpxP family protein refolding chaperone
MKIFKLSHCAPATLKAFCAVGFVTVLAAGCAILPSVSPYAGQESRQIKALSAAEIAAYVEGKGQGFAKPAELNGYPGPMHVLELADQLALTSEQESASEALLLKHKTEVRELGRNYVSAEAALDKLFSSRLVTAEALRAAIDDSARIQSLIRSAHLETHLQQTALLTPEQNATYQRLRGYVSAGHHH